MESYNMPEGMMEMFQEPPKTLTFLDPDLFVGTQSAGGTPIEIEGEFVCVICSGVVLEPVECRSCSSLYCKACVKVENMPCPKRCGASEYTKVNRLIMNALNKMSFKCQYQP